MRIKRATIMIGFLFALNAAASVPWAFDPFMGKWAGTLEYKDYHGGAMVRVPVKLEVRPSDAGTANWFFNYDDFGKTVTSDEVHNWIGGKGGAGKGDAGKGGAGKGGTYTVRTRGRPEVETYTSKDFDALLKAGIGKAILTGSELEDGKKVEVRRTITLEKTSLTTLKETRPPNGVFAFRNQSTYSRQP